MLLIVSGLNSPSSMERCFGSCQLTVTKGLGIEAAEPQARVGEVRQLLLDV